MSSPKEKYIKYKLRYTQLKELISKYEQKGGSLENNVVEKIQENVNVENKVELNEGISQLEKSNENSNLTPRIKNVIKLKDYNNRFIYKNNKDDSFIENLNIQPVNNKFDSSIYYKINNNDDVLKKFVSNNKFFNSNDELRVLNYKDDQIMFEVFSNK